jgi:hypothetical protein
MNNSDEETAQQRRQRGFWGYLKNPKTLATVFWCGKWFYRIVRFALTFEWDDYND